MPRLLPVGLCLIATAMALADGPQDNRPDQVRRIPKLGIEVPAAERAELEQGLAKLQAAIDGLRKMNNPATQALLPDVQVYHKAVSDALKHQEFFDARELPV